jgi:small-conductance mechanosensitive channel
VEHWIDYTLNAQIYGNGLIHWGAAVIGGCGVYVVLSMVRRRLVRHFAQRNAAKSRVIAEILRALARSTQTFFILALALGAFEYAVLLPPRIGAIISAIVRIAVMLQLGLWGTALLGLWIAHYLIQRAEEDPDSASAAQIIKIICLVAIWSAILLLTLSNFGIDITGLVAGLGIGGIAVAFALQSILKDLFASLAIVLDKPFVVGDFIIFGEQLGSVERIGLKTTRVRSLWGEQITVSNDDLLNSRVRNYKRMSERRVSFNVAVTYETPVEKLETIPRRIRETIEAIDGTRFDRSHVAAFEDYGPRIETVYYVLSPDYNVYMDIQQHINLTIARHFAEAEIAFAYPTRRLLGEGRRNLEESLHATAAGPET